MRIRVTDSKTATWEIEHKDPVDVIRVDTGEEVHVLENKEPELPPLSMTGEGWRKWTSNGREHTSGTIGQMDCETGIWRYYLWTGSPIMWVHSGSFFFDPCTKEWIRDSTSKEMITRIVKWTLESKKHEFSRS